MDFQTLILRAGKVWFKIGAKWSAKVSDAKAEERNPAKVIPI